MDYLINEIFGRRALGQLVGGDYVEWAGEMLVRGYDSHSLRILAGLDRLASTFEAEYYFIRSAKELNLTVHDSETAVREYACAIARRLVEGEITVRQGVRDLDRICVATDFERDYMVWHALDDALDSLEHGGYSFAYESVAPEEFDETVKREALDFIAALCGRTAGKG